MRRSILVAALATLVSSVCVSAQELPVKRVTLFSSGVAFFERAGDVDSDVTIELPFKTSQINDILKSLVLQDLGGGTIRPVVYAPKDPIEKALRSFGIDLTGKPTLGALLDQIRGVPVELAVHGDPNAVRGTILGIEKHRTFVDKHVIEEDVLNVVCDDGIRSYKLRDLGRVKLTDEKLDAELAKALAVLAGAHDADKKPVRLEFAGTGTRAVRVSYILEAPIWKTSYRLVLEGDEPFLQGWATVDNTTDEDWSAVELTLVSGRPISFIQDLYQPIYIPRPEVEPELYASLKPQTYEGTVGEPSAEAAAELPQRGRRKAAYTPAEELLGDLKAAKVPLAAGRRAGVAGVAEARLGIALAGAGVASVAAATEAGEMFNYTIATPVTLPRQKSAMLPIVNEAIGAEKFSIYAPGVHAKYPLNGLQLENTTDLHLMQGPVTVFEENTYAGDAQLPDVTPGEKRLISYSLDLKREVETITKAAPEVLTKVRIAKGTLIATRKYAEDRTYNVKNKDDRPRSVLIEQPFRADWDLVEPADPFERTPQVYRFRVEAKPGATTKLVVREERQGDQHIALSNTGLDNIHFYLRAKVISPKVRDALQQVARMRSELDETQHLKKQHEARIEEITRDQARIRENLRTVRQGTDLYNRYIKKLEAQETELDEAREVIVSLTDREAQQRRTLDEYLLKLTVD
ncbi:MAG: DUF4139 domain-containing protein [Phycisphaerales bacterium]|nr:MAG: DUF4139 domain-containing protein [Phycisphaerales bacterium]